MPALYWIWYGIAITFCINFILDLVPTWYQIWCLQSHSHNSGMYWCVVRCFAPNGSISNTKGSDPVALFADTGPHRVVYFWKIRKMIHLLCKSRSGLVLTRNIPVSCYRLTSQCPPNQAVTLPQNSTKSTRSVKVNDFGHHVSQPLQLWTQSHTNTAFNYWDALFLGNQRSLTGSLLTVAWVKNTLS